MCRTPSAAALIAATACSEALTPGQCRASYSVRGHGAWTDIYPVLRLPGDGRAVFQAEPNDTSQKGHRDFIVDFASVGLRIVHRFTGHCRTDRNFMGVRTFTEEGFRIGGVRIGGFRIGGSRIGGVRIGGVRIGG
eukprot:gene4526-4446_t